MRTAYVLFPIALLIFVIAYSVATGLKATSDRRIVEVSSRNIAEVTLIFAVIAGAYSLTSFLLTSIVDSPDVTLGQVKRFDEYLKHSREFWKQVELTTWCFIGLLLLLAPITLLRLPGRNTHPLLQRVGRVAFYLSTQLRRYRKLHKRLTIALAFAVSFTFLPGMSRGDIERLTSARLQEAGKQIAELDQSYREAVAIALANVIVDRSFAALPPNYGASIHNYPDGARYLEKHIQELEGYYKISLTTLHQRVAPLIHRFQPAERHDATKPREAPQDKSAILLTQVLAEGGKITFADVQRVSVQVHDYRTLGNSEKGNTFDQPHSKLPAEVVEEVTSELLSPERLMGHLIEQYPWLEPLLEVISDTTGKIAAGKPFETAWRALERLFERGTKIKDDRISVSLQSRVSELSILIEPNPSVLDAHANTVMDIVISDGLALDELRQKLSAERSQAYAALVASNKARIEALQSRFPPPLDRGSNRPDRYSVDEQIASLVGGTLWSIEQSNGGPAQTRDWLDQLEKAVGVKEPLDRLSAITQLQSKTPDLDQDRTLDPMRSGDDFRRPRFLDPRPMEDRIEVRPRSRH